MSSYISTKTSDSFNENLVCASENLYDKATTADEWQHERLVKTQQLEVGKNAF